MVVNSIIEHLRNNAFFKSFESKTLEKIAERFQESSYGAEEVIFREGDPGFRLFLVTEGEVSIFKDMGWGARELKRFGPGEVFGEMALISHERRTATAQTVGPTQCLTLGQEGFTDLLEQDSKFAQYVMRLLNERLTRIDEASTQDLVNAHEALIFSLAKLAESRDTDTGSHLYRVRAYCGLLAELLSETDRFKDRITPSFVKSIYIVSPLHDIGKVAIPDAVLLKPGRFTPEEREVMNTHTIKGAETVRTALDYCDHETFHMAHRVVLYHHERFDGLGYPEGLKGEEIPLEAAIMSVADVYDALLVKRVYKPPMDYAKARGIIEEMTGAAFDPDISGMMLRNIDQFEEIHRQHSQADDS